MTPVQFLTDVYPFALMLVFLACLFAARLPGKGRFVLRAMGALLVAVFLAHLNRWFLFWPEHRLFPSGHMTFCLGISLSIAQLWPWTLAITLPILVPFGMALVSLHYHTPGDVLGAIPLVLVVYGLARWFWPMPPPSPPLDSRPTSL